MDDESRERGQRAARQMNDLDLVKAYTQGANAYAAGGWEILDAEVTRRGRVRLEALWRSSNGIAPESTGLVAIEDPDTEKSLKSVGRTVALVALVVVLFFVVLSNGATYQSSTTQQAEMSRQAPSVARIDPTLAITTVWYGSALRTLLPQGIAIHGVTHPPDRLFALPQDITHFSVKAKIVGAELIIRGSVTFDALPSTFKVINGTKYFLYLHAYVFDSSRRLVWTAIGGTGSNSWIETSGVTRQYLISDSYGGATQGRSMWIVAVAEPIISADPKASTLETYAILGAIRVDLE